MSFLLSCCRLLKPLLKNNPVEAVMALICVLLIFSLYGALYVSQDSVLVLLLYFGLAIAELVVLVVVVFFFTKKK